jgi:hypothetical protein
MEKTSKDLFELLEEVKESIISSTPPLSQELVNQWVSRFNICSTVRISNLARGVIMTCEGVIALKKRENGCDALEEDPLLIMDLIEENGNRWDFMETSERNDWFKYSAALAVHNHKKLPTISCSVNLSQFPTYYRDLCAGLSMLITILNIQ